MGTLKQALAKKLTKKEIKLVPSSYDMVGSIIIFSDFPKELHKKKSIIGKTVLEQHNHILSVYKKTKEYSGKYRTPKLTWIAGRKSKVTDYKENGITITLDVEKVYFSSRLSHERKRIYEQIKPGEEVLVLFSGSGIYPAIIARNTKAKHITSIELNPIAHKYALINQKKNKIEDKTTIIKGDVKKVLPKLTKKFDRIIMPLPKEAHHFLDVTLPRVKKKGIVHLYMFAPADNYDEAKKMIKQACKAAKKSCLFKCVVKCGQYSPRVFRICIDFVVK